MSKVTITAANPAFTGISAGVQFVNGKAEIELPRQRAALEYFERHRFGISEPVEDEDELLATSQKGNPGQGPTPPAAPAAPAAPASSGDAEPETKASLDKLTRPELDDLAKERGVDISGASNKGDVIDALLAAKSTPAPSGSASSDSTPGTGNTGATADPAGDGPVGAQHNVGHDGADPGNVGTPTTPAPDATI